MSRPPHCPLTRPEPYWSMFDAAKLRLPESVGRWYPGQSPLQLANLPGHMGATVTSDGWRRAWAAYLGMVRLLDDAIGRVLDTLERRGFLDNCLVIFTSDHGEMLGSHRLFQKMCMYEEALRVPMMVRPPETPPGPTTGRRLDALTQHLDLAATLCDWAGVAPPAANRGASMRGLVEGSAAAAGCREVFAEFNGNSGRSFQQRALVTPERKYIHNHGHEPELYRRAGDPQEAHNLCAESQPPAEAEELRSRLKTWMAETGDYLDAACISP